jgi:LPXTG-motif cell wall-anchored protein
MRGHSARRVVTFVGVAGAVVVGFAVPASAYGVPTTHTPCSCSTTTSSTTTTALPPTTTTEAATTTVASTSTTAATTTSILLVPPVTATAPPGSVVQQRVTTTTRGTTTTRDGAETERLPHTGSSPFFPLVFGLGSLTVGVVLAFRRKPREWYGS